MAAFELDLTRRGSLAIERVVNGPIETNTYFAISGDEAVVIDPAWDGEALARKFAEEHPGIRIVALACTHGHGDHVGGVAGMRQVLGDEAPFLLPEGDVAQVQVSIERQRANWGIGTPDPGVPDRLLAEGDVIEFGDVRLQVVFTPGHTEGGVVFFCASESGNVAFVGDTLFPGSHGRTDFPGGDDRLILQSLSKMARLLPDDTLCLIGHGPSTTIGQEKRTNIFMR